MRNISLHLFVTANLVSNGPISFKFFGLKDIGCILLGEPDAPVVVGGFVAVIEHLERALHDRFGLRFARRAVQRFQLTLDQGVHQKTTESGADLVCFERCTLYRKQNRK